MGSVGWFEIPIEEMSLYLSFFCFFYKTCGFPQAFFVPKLPVRLKKKNIEALSVWNVNQVRIRQYNQFNSHLGMVQWQNNKKKKADANIPHLFLKFSVLFVPKKKKSDAEEHQQKLFFHRRLLEARGPEQNSPVLNISFKCCCDLDLSRPFSAPLREYSQLFLQKGCNLGTFL